jgi:hypothetical protein
VELSTLDEKPQKGCMKTKEAMNLPAGALLKVNFRGYGESENFYYIVTKAVNSCDTVHLNPVIPYSNRRVFNPDERVDATFIMDIDAELLYCARRIA